MATELSRPAQKVVETIRHVIRHEPLDDVLAERHATGLVVQPLTGVSTEEAANALREALSSDAHLSKWLGDPRYERSIEEDDFRAHLSRVADRLDAMRPWPMPLFRPLDPPRVWESDVRWKVLGVVRLSIQAVENRIHCHLLPVSVDDSEMQVHVATLELRSGRRIAIVAHWWPNDLSAVAVLSRDPDAAAADVMAELTSEGHFESDEVDVLH